MICSNEPGFYKAGEFGIRIETLISVVEDEDSDHTEMTFFRFETLTLCPIDLNMVDPSLLNHKEIAYLNEYHARTREALEPFLEGAEKQWLKRATQPI